MNPETSFGPDAGGVPSEPGARRRSLAAQIRYRSFLVRLWCELRLDSPEAAAAWQSEVEQIQSGQRWTFGDLDELLNFLRLQAEEAAAGS